MTNYNKRKIAMSFFLLLGLLFLGVAVYFWCFLYEIEQGRQQGELPAILYSIYNVAGKWGVGAIYLLCSIFCFVRVGKYFSTLKEMRKDY